MAVPRAGAQFLQQAQYLRLHGDIERGAGLVRQQDLRLADQRHGNHDALAHAAGELVRVLAHAPRRRPGCAPTSSISMARRSSGRGRASRRGAPAAPR